MGYYSIKNIEFFPKLKHATISKITDNHFILYVEWKHLGKSDYISKSLQGVKMIFSRDYGKGAEWEIIKTPDK